MVYQYVVVLKNQHNRYIDVLGIILSLFSVVCFTNELLVEPGTNVACLLGSIIILLVLAWNIWQSSKKKKVYYSRSLLIAALVWMKMPYFNWLLFVFIILAFLEYQAKYAIEIGFSDNEIIINTLFKKKYQWKQFSNIILKDDILTLDFTNNRIIQRQIEDDEDYEADEEEFNAYCRERLERK
jgi:hypothetical protein